MSRVIFWRSRLLWLIAVTSLITFVLLRQAQQSLKPPSFEQHKFWLYNLEKEEPSPNDQKCQLPRVHPFDESILSYLSLPRIIKCNERQPSLTYIDENGILQFNKSAANQNQFKLSELFCYHQEVVRDDDMKISYGQKIEMTINGSTVNSDFVFVSCTDYSGFAVYSNIHCHVVAKDKWLSNRVQNPKRLPKHNVLIIGIDSISRLSFIRQLPETYQFLSEKLNAFIFRGMTKVGDNTFPNLVAMLTGKSVTNNELPKVQDPKGTYDEWPCLWQNFTDDGYATLYAEDMPKISLFNYLRGGLKNSPTDHYMRPFWLAVEASKRLFLSSSLCFGNIPKHLLQLNYTRAFIQEYSKRHIPFFAFSFFVELSHDYMRIVPSADGDFKSWLEDLFDSGYLNNTFLFFISDHGHRFDSMRATLVGRIEERMPFFGLVVPPSLHETHPQVVESLKLNVGRLTTPYDIYFSVLDVLNHDMQKWQLGTATSSRGTTIFSPISNNRTCEEAGIPDHYCVCEREEPLDISDPRSLKASEVLLAYLNDLVQSKHGNFCSELTLSKIVRSDLIVLPREVIVNSRMYFGKLKEDGPARGMIGKLRIILRTRPGDALFEATLQFREDGDAYSVLGDVSRINAYGRQSDCIDDAVLRKYCFCRRKSV